LSRSTIRSTRMSSGTGLPSASASRARPPSTCVQRIH
jgi:hypothetical protein